MAAKINYDNWKCSSVPPPTPEGFEAARVKRGGDLEVRDFWLDAQAIPGHPFPDDDDPKEPDLP